jgi:hypothetical protein
MLSFAAASSIVLLSITLAAHWCFVSQHYVVLCMPAVFSVVPSGSAVVSLVVSHCLLCVCTCLLLFCCRSLLLSNVMLVCWCVSAACCLQGSHCYC